MHNKTLMKPSIEVNKIEANNKRDHFLVKIEDHNRTEHKVTLNNDLYEEFSNGRSKEQFINDCFRFLLEREPKESILKEFNIEIIGKYFPEWKDEIRTKKC